MGERTGERESELKKRLEKGEARDREGWRKRKG